jgi:cobalt-zinc-cadmium efflux system outer membrane protein
MRYGTIAVAVCATMGLHPGSAAAQNGPLTLADVLSLARQRAPQVVSARLAVEEARGRLLGASIPVQGNPQLEASVGNRNAPGTRYTDFDVIVGQAYQPRSRRSARIAGADAAIAQSSATAEETLRDVLRLAAHAYFQGLHAQERVRLLDTSETLAATVLRVAERRFRAGDIAVLDVNIARAALARIRAEREGAEAGRTLAIGELKQLLQLDGDVRVEGDLTTRSSEPDLNVMLQGAAQRPELVVLEARVREAEAEVRLGNAFARPEYGFGVRFAREEGDQIVLGGVTVTLPIFARGQELQAVGGARAARLRAELDAARTRVQLEVRSTFEAYSRRVAAISMLEIDAIPGLDENESLTTRSFDVGQLGLLELMLVRREILDTRSQHLDALLEAALARIDLDASAGVLR